MNVGALPVGRVMDGLGSCPCFAFMGKEDALPPPPPDAATCLCDSHPHRSLRGTHRRRRPPVATTAALSHGGGGRTWRRNEAVIG